LDLFKQRFVLVFRRSSVQAKARDEALIEGRHAVSAQRLQLGTREVRRPDRETRLKYRYYHQHRGFVEAYEEPLCVGCYRCGRVCLADINPPDIIRDLQTEYQE